MTNADRDRLRRLQDRWLEANARRIAGYPDDMPVTSLGPTLEHGNSPDDSVYPVSRELAEAEAKWFGIPLAEA